MYDQFNDLLLHNVKNEVFKLTSGGAWEKQSDYDLLVKDIAINQHIYYNPDPPVVKIDYVSDKVFTYDAGTQAWSKLSDTPVKKVVHGYGFLWVISLSDGSVL